MRLSDNVPCLTMPPTRLPFQDFVSSSPVDLGIGSSFTGLVWFGWGSGLGMLRGLVPSFFPVQQLFPPFYQRLDTSPDFILRGQTRGQGSCLNIRIPHRERSLLPLLPILSGQRQAAPQQPTPFQDPFLILFRLSQHINDLEFCVSLWGSQNS